MLKYKAEPAIPDTMAVFGSAPRLLRFYNSPHELRPNQSQEMPLRVDSGLSLHHELLIKEARQRLQDAFGPDAEIYTKLSIDPSEPKAAPITFVVARVRMSATQSSAIMDRLDEEWWLDQLDRAEGKVNITFEHRAD